MNKENEVYKHNGISPQDFNEVGQEPIFSNDSIKTISSKSRRILDLIEHRHPISVYQLALISEYSYPTTARICKELEFVGLIKSRLEIGSNNRAVRILFIPKDEVKQ